jgi:hypothetical protein
MPHGGFEHSGYGKDLSLYGLEDYTRVKHVMSAWDQPFRPAPADEVLAARTGAGLPVPAHEARWARPSAWGVPTVLPSPDGFLT